MSQEGAQCCLQTRPLDQDGLGLSWFNVLKAAPNPSTTLLCHKNLLALVIYWWFQPPSQPKCPGVPGRVGEEVAFAPAQTVHVSDVVSPHLKKLSGGLPNVLARVWLPIRQNL